jgi:hypothetical protein
MLSTSDVTDPMYQAALVEAERALDEGEYNEVVHRCADVYRQLAEGRPDLMPSAPNIGALPLDGRQPVRGAARPWPSLLGAVLRVDDNGKPSIAFDKERFTMSEAVTYFEYTLDAAIRAQRTTPA